MSKQTILLYGTEWCGDCFRSRQYLKKHAIEFTFINIDHDKQGEQFVLKTNHGIRRVPTIVFEDGTILVEPSNHELAMILGTND